jgi:hypothetical protein
MWYLKVNNNLKLLSLKGQSHEKFGEMRAMGLSLGHNLESLWDFKLFWSAR